LFLAALTYDGLGLVLDTVERGNEYGQQQCNYGNNDEKLNEAEAAMKRGIMRMETTQPSSRPVRNC
jgi:hypothetical protein